MRHLALLLLCLACGALAPVASVRATDSAPAPRGAELKFAGEVLTLAYVEVLPDGSVLNEYLRSHDTLTRWQVLVSLRYHPDAFVDEIVLRWRTFLTQSRPPGLVLREYADNTRLRQRYGLTVRDPAGQYLEQSETKFVPAADGHGVCYYQAAVRVYHLDSLELVEEARQNLADFAASLDGLTLAPIRTPPGQPAVTEPAKQ